jgi:hypothetical protein
MCLISESPKPEFVNDRGAIFLQINNKRRIAAITANGGKIIESATPKTHMFLMSI